MEHPQATAQALFAYPLAGGNISSLAKPVLGWRVFGLGGLAVGLTRAIATYWLKFTLTFYPITP